MKTTSQGMNVLVHRRPNEPSQTTTDEKKIGEDLTFQPHTSPTFSLSNLSFPCLTSSSFSSTTASGSPSHPVAPPPLLARSRILLLPRLLRRRILFLRRSLVALTISPGPMSYSCSAKEWMLAAQLMCRGWDTLASALFVPGAGMGTHGAGGGDED